MKLVYVCDFILFIFFTFQGTLLGEFWRVMYEHPENQSESDHYEGDGTSQSGLNIRETFRGRLSLHETTASEIVLSPHYHTTTNTNGLPHSEIHVIS